MINTNFSAHLALLGIGMVAVAAYGASAPTASHPLSALAKVSRATAEQTALTRVPGGHVKDGELEREHGHLVWSFDIVQPTTPNVTEVQVDAISGKIVSTAIETPADQAKEAAADRAKARDAKK